MDKIIESPISPAIFPKEVSLNSSFDPFLAPKLGDQMLKPLLQNSQLQGIARQFEKSQGWVLTLLFLLIPGMNLLNPSDFKVRAAVHGFFAFVLVAAGAYLGHLAFLLLRGVQAKLEMTYKMTLITLFSSVAAAISGNWVYMPYRGEHGARERLLATSPFFHKVLMEFKEFITLFPVPLLAAAAFLLWTYRGRLKNQKDLVFLIGMLLMLSWFFTVLGMALGLSIAKVQFV